MDLTEVRAFFDTNRESAEVKELLKPFIPQFGETDAKAFLETDKGRAMVQSMTDSGISKGVAKFEENFKAAKLPSLLEEELLKRNPPKSEAEKKLAEMEQKFRLLEAEKRLEQQRAVALKFAASEGIPSDLVDHFLGDDDAGTLGKLKALKEILGAYEVKVREGFLKANGREPARQTEADIKSLEQQHAEALKRGDMQGALAIRMRMTAR